MARPGKNEHCRRVFTQLMRGSGWMDFSFPGGGMSTRIVSECIAILHKQYGEVSSERLVDYCVCQGFVMNGYGSDYRHRWKVSHSFGEKAIERFARSNAGRRYYEDCWLKEIGLSRYTLLAYIADRSEHPFYRFIFPEYEEHTKRRLLSTEAGFAICALSTLLWTPFSSCCTACKFAIACRKRTEEFFPELYRIRCAAWKMKEVQP